MSIGNRDERLGRTLLNQVTDLLGRLLVLIILLVLYAWVFFSLGAHALCNSTGKYYDLESTLDMNNSLCIFSDSPQEGK